METDRFDLVASQIPAYRDVLLQLPEEIKAKAFDVRLTCGQPVSVWGRDGVYFLRKNGGVTRAVTEELLRVSREEMQEIFVQACGQSVFSHEHEIRKGYILVSGFCRVGICGTAVLENGQLKSVRDVTGMVFRIPREARGCGDRLFLEGVDLTRGLLVAGEPSSGKTTLLRDVIQSLSTGKFQPSRQVAVLDERGELSGGFDLGPCANVLLGYPKAAAFDIAIRMLSPQVIVCDELAPEDLKIVEQSIFAGVPLIATVHAGREELFRRPLCRALLESGAFQTAVCMAGREQPGEIADLTPVAENL